MADQAAVVRTSPVDLGHVEKDEPISGERDGGLFVRKRRDEPRLGYAAGIQVLTGGQSHNSIWVVPRIPTPLVELLVK